ncbi:MAG TPA: GNAT family N-acetyltransferase [Nocardioidaceae bacterium]|nr:GNAT family N-acetyltransferase [Nocardioidaceae bacterium]
MRLRLATHDDVAFLVRVVLETVSARGSDSAVATASTSDGGLAQHARDRIASDVVAGDTYVIELAGDPVGRLRVVRTADCLDMSGLQILPRFQSQGIGSAVIRTLMEEALTSGKILELGVMSSNQRARGLYERLGFREVGMDNSEVRMRWVSW